MITISEEDFRKTLEQRLSSLVTLSPKPFRSVTGPGRSGAIATAYASHFLHVPWFPSGQEVPDNLRPVLVLDTAVKSGRTLRRAGRETGDPSRVEVALFHEPPRVNFWYEVFSGKREE